MSHKFSTNFKITILLFIAISITFLGRQSLALIQPNIDQEITNLNNKISSKKQALKDLQYRQEKYKIEIAKKRRDKLSLKNQLSILEDKLAQAQLDIDATNLEIDKTGLEIEKINTDSANLDKQINTQKNHLAALLRNIYKQNDASALEILLLNNSLTDFLKQSKYLQDINREIGRKVEKLKEDSNSLKENKINLNKKETELLSLKKQLEEKKNDLAYEQDSKNALLKQTRSSEKRFQSLLQQARRDQQRAEREIYQAERLVREKMSIKDRNRLNNSSASMVWPVPSRYVVTKFHDPDYPYRKIIGEHSGLDIRARQGTTLRAAADGYVAKVRFDGTKRYSYIMIIHNNGLSTVYGHISATYVMAGQYVKQGQAIGRSGGMPGGIGSGPFTTGPHLHFEVRLHGIPIDPMPYLP